LFIKENETINDLKKLARLSKHNITIYNLENNRSTLKINCIFILWRNHP